MKKTGNTKEGTAITTIRAVFIGVLKVIRQLLWFWFWFNYGLRLAE